VVRAFWAGVKHAQGKPPKDNRCHKNWPSYTDCYLYRGHEGPCKPWPKLPNITPHKG